MKKRMKKGFTLVEIMIVVAIIAILAAVAIPNFISYRKTSQMNACISNLKQLQTATEQWRMKPGNTGAPSLAGLCGPESTKYIKTTPVCPAGGSYTPPATESDDWECSSQESGYEHKLPSSTGGESGNNNNS